MTLTIAITRDDDTKLAGFVDYDPKVIDQEKLIAMVSAHWSGLKGDIESLCKREASGEA